VEERPIVAAVFDLDGVVTDTASIHAAAWKQLFDEVLSEMAEDAEPFGLQDYLRYVDGRSRRDGVRCFLESRGLVLPAGKPADRSALTVSALAARKDQYFRDRLDQYGVQSFADAVALLQTLRTAKVALAIASASRNCANVLQAAHLDHLFSTRVDGLVADEMQLASKPSPDLFLEAVRRLGTPPDQSMLVEDSLAGVEAGRRGRFGLVVGVDRSGQREELVAAGADVVVSKLTDLAMSVAQERVTGQEAESDPGRTSSRDGGARLSGSSPES